MLYLDSFYFPSDDTETDFLYPSDGGVTPDGIAYSKRITKASMTCFGTSYPFGIFPLKECGCLKFTSPITILYGTNGSGKTTALNVMAEKLHLQRDALYNKAPFMDDFVELCGYNPTDDVHGIPFNSRMIASDDVFNFMLNLRSVNQQIDLRREELFKIYNEGRVGDNANFNNGYSMEMYEKAKKTLAKSKSKSQFIKKNLTKNIREQSNGESALMYFEQKIEENALYLLDEPENSLSPEKQIQLVEYIESSAKGCGCQFIIATHSPFLLAMRYSEVYDLDETPVCKKNWTELKNVRQYWDFFKSHENEFQ